MPSTHQLTPPGEQRLNPMTDKMACPKCGFKQQPAEECAKCGILFHKLNGNENNEEKNQTISTVEKTGPPVKTPSNLFRNVRIALLLALLLAIGLDAWLSKSRATDWDLPLWVVLYPINGDGSETSAEYINSLQIEYFETIEQFFGQEANDYGLTIEEPFNVRLAPQIHELPPPPPINGSVLSTIWWSLKFRYWSWRTDTFGRLSDIRIYLLYHSPETHKQLNHSFGIEEGFIAVAKIYAHDKFTERNNVVISHELLHTIGASDKYDLSTGLPIYPDGYGDPDRKPLLPQETAEIMGTQIVISETLLKMPEDLWETVISLKTAKEINWVN